MEFSVLTGNLHSFLENAFVGRGWSLSVLSALETACAAILLFLCLYLFGFFIFQWEKQLLAARKAGGFGPVKATVVSFFRAVLISVSMVLKGEGIPRFSGRPAYWLLASAVFICIYFIGMVIPFGRGAAALDLREGLIYVLPFIFVIGLMRSCIVRIEEQYSAVTLPETEDTVFLGYLLFVLSVLPVCFLAKSASFPDIVRFQADAGFMGLPGWVIFYPLIGQISFVIYIFSLLMIYDSGLRVLPVDSLKYSSVDALRAEVFSRERHPNYFMWLNRYVFIFVGSSLAVVLFLGGGSGPFLTSNAWFLIKALCVAPLFIWAGLWIADIRMKMLMEFYWKIALPLSVVNTAVSCYYTSLF